MSMQRVGDDTAGFAIDFPDEGSVAVVAWGFWTVDVAAAFSRTVVDACLSKPRGAAVSLDMSDVKPMRDEGQAAFTRLLRSLPAAAFPRISIITRNPLTKLQLVRLVTEAGAGTRVDWVTAAKGQARHSSGRWTIPPGGEP